MNKIGIAYFLIFIIIFILTNKYLKEISIIENFYENEPKLSIDELRTLSKFAHSFVNGDPLKIPYNLIALKFYIGNKLIDSSVISALSDMAHPDRMLEHFEDKSKVEGVYILAGIPPDVKSGALTMNLTYPNVALKTPVKTF